MLASILTSKTGYTSGIEPLTGTNFSTWRDQVKLTLGVMDLDHALRIDPPAALTVESTTDHKCAYEQWERSNKEERLKVEKPDIVHVATTNSNKRNDSRKGKGSSGDNSTPNKVQKTDTSTSSFQGGPKCKFCHNKGHTQKDCPNLRNGNKIQKNSSRLWHQHLGHISRDGMTRLVKDEVLPNLDFSDFEKCVECIKGKMTKGNKKCATRSTGLLELIHTDICWPFPSGIGGHKLFITFIDDYSRYMYLFLINEKSESLEMFKTFKAEVENQLDRKIKVVRSDRGGEYYCRHTDVGQTPGSFFDFCKDHEIINQYTMPGTPHTRIIETRLAKFLENANNSGSGSFRRIELQVAQDETHIIHVTIPISIPLDTSNDHLIAQDHPNNVEENEPNLVINIEPQETQQPLRRSQRNRQPTNFDDYYTYLNEADFDLGKFNDPEYFEDAITYDQSAYWREAMEDELNSMSKKNNF
ncbi:putative zinc finger, CCHC-type containing protein [Tanacetum coccineum]